MEARLAALQPFYASLTPEQKKVFDAQRGQRRGHGHRGHHGMQHKGA
jgi:Spy/CpxP family protein refolding chaperone